MRKIILFIVFVASVFSIKAQQNTFSQYESAIHRYDKLLSGQLTPEERKRIMEDYSYTCYEWGINLMSGENGNLDKARDVFQMGLKYAEGEVKRKSLYYIGMAWLFEGADKQIKEQHKQAYSCYEKALAVYKEINEEKEVLGILDKMATIQKSLSDVDKALCLYDEVISLAESSQDTVVWVNAYRKQRNLYSEMGKWDKYIPISLKIDSLTVGTQNVELQLSDNYEQGDNAWKRWNKPELAESIYKKNLDLILLLPEMKRDGETYETNVRLRDLMFQQQRYEESLKYSWECIVYTAKIMKPTSSKYYFPYLNRAEIFRAMGDRDSTFSCLDTYFLGQKCGKLEPKELARQYCGKGRMHGYFKEYDAAVKNLEYADDLLKQDFSETDGSRMNYLALKAGMLAGQKKYEESKQCYTRYATLCRKKYGENSMEYAEALYALANIDGFNGDKEAGCEHYARSTGILESLIRNRFRYLPSNVRETYWNELSKILWNMAAYSVKIGANQEPFTKEAYNALLFSKGLLLESEKSMNSLLKQSGTEEDERGYFEMMRLCSLLPDLEKNYDENKDSISLIYSQIDKIDKQLAQHCLSYGNYTDFLNLNYKDIRNNLAKNEVIVDFTDYKSDSETHQYMAYVVRKEWENPLLLPLFDQQQIDSLLQANGGHWDRLYQSSVSDAFLQMCWKPISKYVSTGETIYYIPSGILHQVVLESLPASSEALLGDKFRFIRLSSAREIVSQNEVKPSEKKSAALYGGLLYDVDMAVMEMESKKYDVSKLYALRGNEVHGDSVFHYLPMTRKEVDEIGKVLAGCHVDTVSYTGHTGTKESFINLNGNAPQIIHLATHGFYYTPNDALNIEPLSGYKNAMKLSGLIMAGGNAAWAGKRLPPGVLDGILTADDIARLDLNGTELVVLSACETGLGKVTSEGLFGLQRAFKKAGVQTLVMSLWKVSDWITKEFMLQFYKNLAANGWEKRKAFEDAKSSIRKTYEEPFYWAGFVMLD